MKKIVFTFCLVLSGMSMYAQVTSVQHLNAHSRQAPELFKLFHETFGLPVVYDYQSFGSFSSGGLWLGNVTFEFVGAPASSGLPGFFFGIALEPKGHTDSIVTMLDERRIAHAVPEINYWNFKGKKEKFYTVTVLKDLSAKERRVFVCDYEQRDFIKSYSARADSLFKAGNGGPLRITGLKAIVIEVADKDKQAELWASIPGVKKINDHTFSFDGGPAIVLDQDGGDGIKEIIIKVQSKEKAAAFLAQQSCLKKENDRILIDPGKLDGLKVVLED